MAALSERDGETSWESCKSASAAASVGFGTGEGTSWESCKRASAAAFVVSERGEDSGWFVVVWT